MNNHEQLKRGMTVAYLRVSTSEQKLDRQDDVREGADKVFEEKTSASTRNRPKLVELLNFVREGDLVRVHSIDRLARSMRDLTAIVNELKAKGVAIEFVKDRLRFDPLAADDPFATLQFHVLGAYAEFERALNRARQADGIARAKAKGVYRGSVKLLSDDQAAQVKERIAQKVSVAQVAREFAVSRSTIYRVLAVDKGEHIHA